MSLTAFTEQLTKVATEMTRLGELWDELTTEEDDIVTKDYPKNLPDFAQVILDFSQWAHAVYFRQEKPMNVLIMLDPEKYGYVVCEECNGYGSSLKQNSDRCTECGGSGLVKKDDKANSSTKGR